MNVLQSTFYDNKTGFTGLNQFISVLRQKENKHLINKYMTFIGLNLSIRYLKNLLILQNIINLLYVHLI